MIEEALKAKELKWEALTTKRGTYLITPGEIEQYIYYVKNGALRAFILTEEEEHTIRFAYSNSIFTSINSFFTGAPSTLFIQAIRKSELLRTSKTLFEAYVQKDLMALSAYQHVCQHERLT